MARARLLLVLVSARPALYRVHQGVQGAGVWLAGVTLSGAEPSRATSSMPVDPRSVGAARPRDGRAYGPRGRRRLSDASGSDGRLLIMVGLVRPTTPARLAAITAAGVSARRRAASGGAIRRSTMPSIAVLLS
jgi:hypothetical protein